MINCWFNIHIWKGYAQRSNPDFMSFTGFQNLTTLKYVLYKLTILVLFQVAKYTNVLTFHTELT